MVASLSSGPYGKAILYSIAALLIGGCGWALLVDRPGLRLDLFPLSPTWDGEPVSGGIAEPQVESREQLSNLVSKEIFSARWQGWLWVERVSEYTFRIAADEDRYFAIDGKRRPDDEVAVFLARGFHPIEIGFNQTRRQSWLQSSWIAAGGELTLIPVEHLYSRHPVLVTRLWRQILVQVPIPVRRLFGAGLILAALLLLQAAGGSSGFGQGPPVEPMVRATNMNDRTALDLTLLASLFVVTWIWTTRFTAPLMGGDDVLYLHKALFPAKGQWFYNRYIHVYLLKAFVWLRDGDGFLGSRTYWSFTFSTTVAALAVACRCLGLGLQLRTLAATLFLLLSQTSLFGRACGGFADFSCMMFVTVAVVVYLHALFTEQKRGRHGWHELAIGVLTVAACKSKETGIILAWLPLLFLWTEGRVDIRGFARKMFYWSAGVAIGWFVLMSLDAWLLGDFWYSVTPDLAAIKRLHVTQEMQLGRSITRWTMAAWSPHTNAASHALRYLWILALLAPIVAVVKRKRVELCLLFLMPLAYLVLLMAVHARAPHIFSTRYFFTILPVCCLVVGATFYFLGLEELSWKEILRPKLLIPLFVACSVLVLWISPIRSDGAQLAFGAGLVTFWLACLLVVGVIVMLARWKAWPAVVMVVLLVLFGPSFARVQQNLAPRLLAQRGELLLYPWSTFQDELEAASPETLVVPPELWRVYRMVGQQKTREQIAQIFFRRDDLRMWQHRDIGPDVDYAIAAPEIFKTWRRQVPGLQDASIYDPSGRFALVQPKAALQARTD